MTSVCYNIHARIAHPTGWKLQFKSIRLIRDLTLTLISGEIPQLQLVARST